MNTKTLKALKGSIEKWEKIVSGKGKDEGACNCPLCHLFNKSYISGDATELPVCKGCPVRSKTQQDYCKGTPYYFYSASKLKSKQEEKYAIEELNFLKSLLPPSKSK